MEQEERLFEKRCPYWSLKQNKECGMSKGGMYIPMPEHVKMFCLVSNYTQCRQYIRGCEEALSENNFSKSVLTPGQDRRRQKRFRKQLYFDLVVCNSVAGLQPIKSYKAQSIDVSLGGVRIESFKEFARDTVISFSLAPDLSSESLLGVGEIKWCEPLKGSVKFQSGLAFANHSSSECMRRHLGL